MPLTVLQHKAGRLTDDMLAKLSRALPEIVAPALDVPGNPNARVKPDEIEVWVQQSSPLDRNICDFAVIVFANEYPERLATLEERKNLIVSGIRVFLADYDRNLEAYVWVRLAPAAFGKI